MEAAHTAPPTRRAVSVLPDTNEGQDGGDAVPQEESGGGGGDGDARVATSDDPPASSSGAGELRDEGEGVCPYNVSNARTRAAVALVAVLKTRQKKQDCSVGNGDELTCF